MEIQPFAASSVAPQKFLVGVFWKHCTSPAT